MRNLRPTTLVLSRQPDKPWTRLDFLLMEAYQVYEDEMSKSSGIPVWLTRSLDPDIGFVVEERTDQADAALEKYDKEHSGDKKKFGTTRFAVATDSIGNPIEYDGHTRHRFQVSAIQDERVRQDVEADEGEYEDDLEGLGIGASASGGFNPAEYGDGM